ncbi:MAG: hypothetical protein IMW83_04225 [Caldanaerobacter subterraneus]|nr:hypothetical protein [Caldanaerobacter subterraneus]
MVKEGKEEFEKELKELEEWQENQYNPGYYIGSGRVPRPLEGLKKRPIFLMVIALSMILPLIGVLFSKISAEDLIAFVFPAFIGVILFYAAIREMLEKRKFRR